jgi:hypothetical protein
MEFIDQKTGKQISSKTVRITWPRKVTLLGTVTFKRPAEANADPSMRDTDLRAQQKNGHKNNIFIHT